MNQKRNPYAKVPSINQSDITKWQCTACNKIVPVESLHNGLDNGLQLSGFAGYYGGFTDQFDNMSQDQFDQYDKAHFCHSCCVKLFKSFPTLATNIGLDRGWGHHPCEEEQPCCDYSWKLVPFEDKTYTNKLFTSARDEDHVLYWKEDTHGG